MGFTETIETVGKGIDAAGVAVIVIGAVIATAKYGQALLQRDGAAFRLYRRRLGQAILLGLEFLVAADIVRTVAIAPTFESVGVLAIIVLIRTFLSMTLELEINGRWPWQQAPPRDRAAATS